MLTYQNSEVPHFNLSLKQTSPGSLASGMERRKNKKTLISVYANAQAELLPYLMTSSVSMRLTAQRSSHGYLCIAHFSVGTSGFLENTKCTSILKME